MILFAITSWPISDYHSVALLRCPLHQKGGCGLTRHGTYSRKTPPGTLIARWYCPEGHCTFSLLPDCLAARMPGTLVELEEAVKAAEQAPSQERACDNLRLEATLPGVLRWLRRRLKAVRCCLIVLKGLLPERFSDCAPTIPALSARLGFSPVLPELREIAAPHLRCLPAPIGFAHRCSRGGGAGFENQHKRGADPPD